MERPKILFALSDNVERSKLETVLRPLDIEPLVVNDGAGVIESAVKEAPAIIVTDMGLKVIALEKVLSILRNNAQSASIPFFFISDRAIDIPNFKPGTDTFLLRPLNAEEVLSRFTRTLESRAGRRTGAREIIGKLNQMGLPDILQFLNINRRDGELRVARGALSGTVFLKDGEVLNAVLEGVEKEKALYRMLSWPDGEFEFVPCTVTITRKILSSSSNLLMEGMRQIDEYNRSINSLPSPEECLNQVSKETVPEGLHPAAYEILRNLSLHKLVRELVERSTYPDFEVYSAITTLITKGLVKVDKKALGSGESIFSIEESLMISDRLASRTASYAYPDTAKVFILSTSPELVEKLLDGCGRVPDFKILSKSFFSDEATGGCFGEVASLKLTTGMEVLLFSVPVVHSMGPLLRAFSSNIIGILLITDTIDSETVEKLVQERDALSGATGVPTVHLCSPGDSPVGPGGFEKSLALGPNDTLWQFDTISSELVSNIFRQLMTELLV
ncbi:MAG: DUF4388 domain-containing protein [Proteobacteria bacterium]|nr:DUF4388 domain-containing protein [Pseudomonadota bacterium]